MPEITRFSPADASAEVVAEIRSRGVAIIERLFEPAVMDQLMATLAPLLDAQEPGGGDFFGHQKRSVMAIFSRGVEFSEHLLLNEKVLEVMDGILLPDHPMATANTIAPRPPISDAEFHTRHDPAVGPNCHHYRINATVAMQVCQGGSNQPLHRDEWRYRPYLHRDPKGPELSLAVMVALGDFTAVNGATRFVPGSNHWPEERRAQEAEVVQAVMPKGSVALWLGSVYHGLGTNTQPEPRNGLIYSFVLDHLTQEENQFMAVPPEIAQTLPPRAQQLLGYRSSHGLNYIEALNESHILHS